MTLLNSVTCVKDIKSEAFSHIFASADNFSFPVHVGHGIGTDMHESPDVPNFGTAGRGTRLCAGMTLAIEPMVNVGTEEVKELSDGWTVKTKDGSLSAHYEYTVALTSEGVLILTQVEKGF